VAASNTPQPRDRTRRNVDGDPRCAAVTLGSRGRPEGLHAAGCAARGPRPLPITAGRKLSRTFPAVRCSAGMGRQQLTAACAQGSPSSVRRMPLPRSVRGVGGKPAASPTPTGDRRRAIDRRLGPLAGRRSPPATFPGLRDTPEMSCSRMSLESSTVVFAVALVQPAERCAATGTDQGSGLVAKPMRDSTLPALRRSTCPASRDTPHLRVDSALAAWSSSLLLA
jgi:hypothetical protein